MVDKIFYLAEPEAHSKFQTLIQDVPMEHMILGEEIISEAKARLGKKLNDMIYISLIDHVHTAILRFLEGITVKNALLWDIRRFYREEYQIGLWALEHIEEKCKVRLPEDEAELPTMMFGRIVVLPEYRKHGLGRLIVTEAEKWARELGCRKAVLDSRDVAVGFYEKLGYTAYPDKVVTGWTFTCIHMEKVLE